MHKSNTINMPIIMGNNSHEGIIMLLDSYKKLDLYDSDLARMIPTSLNLQSNSPECEKIASEMRDIYFCGQPLNKHLLDNFINLHSDYHFGIGLHMSAELYARKQSNAPVYLYDFQHDGKMNHFKKIVEMRLQIDNIKGACHCDEIFYLFRQTRVDENDRPILGKSLSTSIANHMCTLWTNFAKYSNPTPTLVDDDNDKCDIQWNAVKSIASESESFDFNYLAIGDQFEMKSNPAMDRIKFWRNLYKKWNGSFLKPKL